MLSYCAYQGCTNKNVPCSSITFFTLPKDQRRQVWIENSGNIQLRGIGPNSVRYFCEKHFDPIYLKRQFTRTILHKSAVPYKYENKSSHQNANIKTENRDILEIDDDYNLHALDQELSNNAAEDVDSADAIEIIQESEALDEQNQDEDYSHVEYVSPSLLDVSYEKEHDFLNEQKSDINFECDTNNDESQPLVELAEDRPVKKCYKRIKRESPEQNRVKRRTTSVSSEDGRDYNNKASSSSDYTEKRSCVSSSSMDYEEDKHFALSLVGYFQRLPMKKKALAKLKILQYLTQIQYDEEANL